MTARMTWVWVVALAACTVDKGAPAVDGGADPGDAEVVAQADARTGACAATDPRAQPVEVAALPDAGEAPYVSVLSRAQHSIRVMVYLMGAGGIMDTLVAKAKAGVSVKIILDLSEQSPNQKYFDQLTAAGAQVIWSDPQFTYMHAKTFVVDEREAVISTGNYSNNFSIKVERNFVAHDTDPADVADVVALFDADFARQTPNLACSRLVVSPINSRERVLALINSAHTSLLIESMQFADGDVRNAVLARKAAGVDVRAILAPTSWITANADAATLLMGHAIPVRWMENPNVHVKAVVADGMAYMGSENFSYTSLNKNREIGLIVTEAAGVKVIADTFEHDWTVATPF